MQGTKIVNVNKQYISEWSEMRNNLWPSSIDKHKDNIFDFLKDPDNFGFIAYENGTPVGFIESSVRKYANGSTSSPVVFLEGIWVEKDYRRQSIARKLLNKIEEWAKSNNYTEICSDCDINNQISIASHKSWGFNETERVVYFRKSLNP